LSVYPVNDTHSQWQWLLIESLDSKNEKCLLIRKIIVGLIVILSAYNFIDYIVVMSLSSVSMKKVFDNFTSNVSLSLKHQK